MPNLSAQSVGRYHIIQPLGKGGMATVYKAYDTHLERDVAIEIIRTGQIVSDYLEKSKSGLDKNPNGWRSLRIPISCRS